MITQALKKKKKKKILEEEEEEEEEEEGKNNLQVGRRMGQKQTKERTEGPAGLGRITREQTEI